MCGIELIKNKEFILDKMLRSSNHDVCQAFPLVWHRIMLLIVMREGSFDA